MPPADADATAPVHHELATFSVQIMDAVLEVSDAVTCPGPATHECAEHNQVFHPGSSAQGLYHRPWASEHLSIEPVQQADTHPHHLGHHDKPSLQWSAPVQPIQLPTLKDFKHNKFIDAFLRLSINMGQYSSDEGNMICRDDYTKIYTMHHVLLQLDSGPQQKR